jgi:hypothetical protein
MDKAWAGVDVGKEFHWAHVVDASGRELLSRTHLRRAGHKRVASYLRSRSVKGSKSLLVYWGEGHIYHFCSKWLKSSSTRLGE